MNGTAYGEERKEGVNAYQVLQAVITTPDCTLCNMFTKIRGRLGTGQDDISLKVTKISKYHDTHNIFIIQTFRK
jgi:hypothetical protein